MTTAIRPENCRWVTRGENLRNKRNNVYVEFDGGAPVSAGLGARYRPQSPHALPALCRRRSWRGAFAFPRRVNVPALDRLVAPLFRSNSHASKVCQEQLRAENLAKPSAGQFVVIRPDLRPQGLAPGRSPDQLRGRGQHLDLHQRRRQSDPSTGALSTGIGIGANTIIDGPAAAAVDIFRAGWNDNMVPGKKILTRALRRPWAWSRRMALTPRCSISAVVAWLRARRRTRSPAVRSSPRLIPQASRFSARVKAARAMLARVRLSPASR